MHRCSRLSRQRVLLAVLLSLAATPALAQARGSYGEAPWVPAASSGSVSGQVRGADGVPLDRVVVRLDELERGASQHPAVQRVDTTAADGRFAFPGVADASYVMTFERDSLATRRMAVTVRDRATIVSVVLVARGAPQPASELQQVVVTARPTPPPPVIGSLPDMRGTEIFAGKKTEVIAVDSVPMNTAQDVARQLFSRTPGANIIETASSGFPSNGIAFRGLNPVQSVEMNVRQDGVNIVAD
ncbi:MAG: carboxypeptidase-like regulatory domain-containing protein, partial [Gemmatimonadota bacterium]